MLKSVITHSGEASAANFHRDWVQAARLALGTARRAGNTDLVAKDSASDISQSRAALLAENAIDNVSHASGTSRVVAPSAGAPSASAEGERGTRDPTQRDASPRARADKMRPPGETDVSTQTSAMPLAQLLQPEILSACNDNGVHASAERKLHSPSEAAELPYEALKVEYRRLYAAYTTLVATPRERRPVADMPHVDGAPSAGRLGQNVVMYLRRITWRDSGLLALAVLTLSIAIAQLLETTYRSRFKLP